LGAEAELLDCRGLRCPLPVLKTEKLLGRLPAGARVVVLTTDPVARVDIPLYCRQQGHVCSAVADGDAMRFEIVKA
jgi:tRNA 2-thiouridine synthesizing protein A